MEQFPKNVEQVKPLYDATGIHDSPLSSERPSPKKTFNYRSALKIIRAKMYEPVSDQVDVPMVAPKFSEDYDDGPPEKPPRRKKMDRGKSIFRQESIAEETMRNGTGDICIDVDHINVEANNVKNHRKPVDVFVQTSHLVPYRLRFWPSCDVKCDPKESVASKVKCACRILTQWILSQFGLTLIVILWASLGAFVFHNTEGPRELKQPEELAKLQKELSVELATELRQTDEHKESWPNITTKYVKKHERLLLDAVSAGYGEGGGGGYIWTYPGCILFAVSLLTTLGFGAPVPRTSMGRVAAVLFSAVGIPLHFLLVLNMGNLCAVKLLRLAHRDSYTDVPSPPRPRWLKYFPVISILFYYLLGVLFFGFLRQRPTVDCFMFPLDFTAVGGVATTEGHLRILYALYLELAVTLAALVVSLIQASATRGVVDLGLKLGLLTNT